LTPSDVHVEVEAPFVFRGDEPPPVDPAPTREAQLLPLRPLTLPPGMPPAPPTLQPKPAHPGVFGKIKGFFSSLFG
jgi:hypothetical protein